MNAAEWAALYAGLPTFLAAVTALITAIRAKSTAKAASAQVVVTSQALSDHLANEQFPMPTGKESLMPPKAAQ
jgi:hypothetical protein